MFKVDELLEATKGKLISGRRDLQAKGISLDSRTIKPGEVFIAIKGDNFDGHDFIDQAIKNGAVCVIKDLRPATCDLRAASFIEVKDTIKALGDIAKFRRSKFAKPVIAVTGSNGKTTTKEMIAWVLAKKFKVFKNEGTKNNRIGLPMTLVNLDSGYDIIVLEIGTNHFGEVSNLASISGPNIGVITNIGPAHLEFLRNSEGVFREKYSLMQNLRNPYIGILNSDDNLLKKKAARGLARPFILSFGIKNPADFIASGIRRTKGRLEFLLRNKYKFTLPTLGVYNIYNALASVAVARIFGLGYKDIIERLSNFEFPCGRLNFLILNKIRFIDDTYNSNPLSLSQALEALANFKVKGRKIFIMGDMMELGKKEEEFHLEAGQMIADTCDAFISVGKLSKLAAKHARACGFDIKGIFSCEDSRQARDILFNKISPRPDDIVLIKGSRAMRMEEVLK